MEMPYFNKQVAIGGIKFYLAGCHTFMVRSSTPLNVLSSAVMGGDLCQASCIINHTVDEKYDNRDPERDLRELVRELYPQDDVIGLMTAIFVDKTEISYAEINKLKVASISTSGVGNGCAAGLPAETCGWSGPGTINIILIIDGNLTGPAMVNAVITATEAKVRALMEKGITLPGGKVMTGTNTDAIVVACTGRGDKLSYAGPATEVGYLIGKTVFDSVSRGIGEYVLYHQRGGSFKSD